MDTPTSSSLPAIERQHLPALFAARPTDAHKGSSNCSSCAATPRWCSTRTA
ncbi:Uncharacterised protein [Bordetella pertussis]|nr:Uncharacterised protein [Bordetella pertussis]